MLLRGCEIRQLAVSIAVPANRLMYLGEVAGKSNESVKKSLS